MPAGRARAEKMVWTSRTQRKTKGRLLLRHCCLLVKEAASRSFFRVKTKALCERLHTVLGRSLLTYRRNLFILRPTFAREIP